MKILLVHVGTASAEYPFRSHPLGIMYLASYIEREFQGATVELIDMKVSGGGPEGVAAEAARLKPELVGLSSLSVHSDYLEKTANAVKKAWPSAYVIAGGPHPTCFPQETLKSGGVDAVVLGEGENVIKNALIAISLDRSPEGITALGTTMSLNPVERDIVQDIDKLPFPAWKKIDLPAYERYSSFSILGRRRYMSLFTSRACPFNCVYCHNIFGSRFRARSAGGVLEEIRTIIKDFDIREFDVLDDVFNFNRERAVEICEAVISEKMNIKLAFPNGLRSDLLDDELLRLFRRAGTMYISFAVETASPRLQKLIRKNLKIDLALRAIKTAVKEGIFTNCYFMMGFPTETESELRSTLNFAVKSPLHTAHYSKVTPFKGTELYSLIDAETIKKIEGSPDIYKYEDRSFNLSDIPNSRFRILVRRGLRRFYLNPIRLFSIYRAHPYKRNILSFVKIALLRIFVKG